MWRIQHLLTSLVAQMVKYLPAVQESQVQSLDWEDHLQKGKATFSSILAWRILWTKKPGWATVHGIAELDMTESSHMLVK